MAVLSDIFVSLPPVAGQYDPVKNSKGKGQLFEVVQYKGLTNLEIGTLWAIMDSEEFDFDKHALESIKPQESTWLFRLPDPLVQRLAGLSSESIAAIAPVWADTEELQWAPSEAEEVIVDMVRLAKSARSQSKSMYLWGSL